MRACVCWGGVKGDAIPFVCVRVSMNVSIHICALRKKNKKIHMLRLVIGFYNQPKTALHILHHDTPLLLHQSSATILSKMKSNGRFP